MNTNQEKETDERIAVLVTNLSLLALRLGEGPPPSPRLRLCCLYTKFLNKIFINMHSNNTLDYGCPTFLRVRATFTGEKLLRATCIFTKIKLQIIASLLYNIGAHFGQYLE